MAGAVSAAADARVLEHVNAMPAPTWGWLKINEAEVELPGGLVPAGEGAIAIEASDPAVLDGAADAFPTALEEAGSRYPARRAAAPGDATHRTHLAAGQVGPLDVPALSRYQEGAIRLEEELSCVEAFETGLGETAHGYLRSAAGKPLVVDVPAGTTASVTVHVDAVDGAAAVAAVDLVARADATAELTIVLDSPAGGAGLAGYSLRVFAGPRARVAITTLQTLDDGYTAMEDTGLFLDEGAHVDVRHTVLGAGAAYTGLAGDLLGDRARATVSTSYLGARGQLRDFNYELRHRGRATQSDMQANGVLAGSAHKTLRGTIDLVHGCKGSQGNEREVVLLADERVRNKTVPVILCDEDDVAGNHGATIGHVRPEQLFYLGTRGLSAEEAEALFLRAKLEEAALSAPDARARAGVVRLGSRLFPDFEEELS